MKSSKLILGCLITLGLATSQAMAQDDAARDAMAERLAPVGSLCLEGQDCGSAAMAAAGGDGGGASGGADGEAVYGSICMACHDTGVAGAPKRGDEAAWAERTTKGFDTLLDHALNGFNAMPARGGNPNLSDEEVHAAVAYLVEPVMDVPSADAAATEDASTDAAALEETAAEDTAAADTAASDPAAEDQAANDEAAADGAAVEMDPAVAAIDGAAVYGGICMACHEAGIAGAPVRGDAAAWEPRLAQGFETLYDHAINGFNAMPPKGGNPSLSDDEIKAAVHYMVQ
ncbi:MULTISPECIES: c-type cytochrome [Halomonas]|uniref:c-type cytochrome n=1 Tax=Halomonas TaxID=2745 RepID=UPI001CD5DE48|nr:MULTISPECIES: c-type cytochrome [Halomonas]MCA0915945.1 c-type cytochrome [Halomonas denitrificans]